MRPIKTFEKLVKRFKKHFPDYSIYFDWIESHKGFYRVYISSNYYKIQSYYTFKTCKEFKEWIDNVILE